MASPFLQAAVPVALVHLDGRFLLYYVDVSQRPSAVALAVTRDVGRFFASPEVRIPAPEVFVPVDPYPVLLPASRVRLYYYSEQVIVPTLPPQDAIPSLTIIAAKIIPSPQRFS